MQHCPKRRDSWQNHRSRPLQTEHYELPTQPHEASSLRSLDFAKSFQLNSVHCMQWSPSPPANLPRGSACDPACGKHVCHSKKDRCSDSVDRSRNFECATKCCVEVANASRTIVPHSLLTTQIVNMSLASAMTATSVTGRCRFMPGKVCF
jgi:hypothetical protein